MLVWGVLLSIVSIVSGATVDPGQPFPAGLSAFSAGMSSATCIWWLWKDRGDL